MGKLKNDRWERFAQGLASGKSATDAHADAGYARNGRNADRLKKTEEIMRRVFELQERAAHRAECTLESHLRELAKIRDAAFDAESFSAAATAEHHRGKASGHYIERVERGEPGAFDGLTDAELARRESEIDAQLARLGRGKAADQDGAASETRH